ncbi:hypothetical protein YC2023_115143 [Brassica napus]
MGVMYYTLGRFISLFDDQRKRINSLILIGPKSEAWITIFRISAQMDLNEEDYHRHASHHHAPFYSVSPFTTTTTARSSTPPPESGGGTGLMNEAQEIDGGGSSGGS